jgi:hypothetical protein
MPGVVSTPEPSTFQAPSSALRSNSVPKVFPCYSPADRELAQQLAAFLERGAGVEVLLEEGEMRPGEDLIAKVQEGLSADVALALLSPRAVPDRWILERWRFAFWEHAAEVGTPVAVLLCEDCKFPELLRRKFFFDLRGRRLEAFRAIKRWLLSLWPAPHQALFVAARQPSFAGREAELEILCTALADAPGMAVVANAGAGSGKTALALEFAYRHREDFDAILWLTCGARTAAALAGDLAAQLGVRLDRGLESNLHQLRQLCAHHRCLLVLDDAVEGTAALLAPRGRTSVLMTSRQADLAGALSAQPLLLEGRPPVPLFDLDPDVRRLLTAMCACAPSGFRLEVAARTAGIGMPQAIDGAARLLSQGMLTELDQNGPRFLVPATARSVAEDQLWRLRHARAVADLFDVQTSGPGDLTQFWPDLQHALHAALEMDWTLAGALARRAVAWARAQDRLAEAFEILEVWSRAAEPRSDRRVLEDSSWEQIWILEHWDRPTEARALDGIRRKQYADQLAFDFGQS